MYWYEKILLAALRVGGSPQHIAFIMDGNRRFARQKLSAAPIEGHSRGYDKLQQTLEWCLQLGVRVVTVYAFSIENFRRPAAEVDAIMQLAFAKFEKMRQRGDIIERHHICIRVLGDVTLLPDYLQNSLAKCVSMSKHNSGTILNICIAYTSHQEFERSAAELIDGLERNEIKPTDITDELFQRCMYTEDCPLPDLLIRTSGETRLSDFLLYQANHTRLCFLPSLWPELSLWDLARCVLNWQRHRQVVDTPKPADTTSTHSSNAGFLSRSKQFLHSRSVRAQQFIESLL